MTERAIIISADPCEKLWAVLHDYLAEPDIETIAIDSSVRAVITFTDGGTGIVERSPSGAFQYRAESSDPLYTSGSVLSGRD